MNQFNSLEEEIEDDCDDFINWQRPCDDVMEMKKEINTASQFDTPTSADQGMAKGSKIDENHSRHPRCVIHVDFDCFYAQVEMIKNPSLKGKPLAVYQKYVLVTSNYVARGLGVKKMSTKADGIKACPELILINGEDLSPYREYSAKMFELIKQFSPLVERVGLDENYIDVTAKVDELLSSALQTSVKGHCYGFTEIDVSLEMLLSRGIKDYCDCGCIQRLAAASFIASNLRSVLYSKLGLTASAGIAHNKVLAKLIGKTHKPNQQTTIFPAYSVQFLSDKIVREIPGIGSHSAKLLKEMGVTTVQQLGSKSKSRLIERFGAKLGTFMSNIAFGIDNTEVNPSDNMLKSLSEEESFRKLTDYNEVKRQILLLVKNVLARVDESKRLPKTIKLTLRKHFTGDNYSRVSRQAPFNHRILSIQDQTERIEKILKILLLLFDKMIDRSSGFDLAVINVGFTNFEQISSATISNFFANDQAAAAFQVENTGEEKNIQKIAIVEDRKETATIIPKSNTSKLHFDKIRSNFAKSPVESGKACSSKQKSSISFCGNYTVDNQRVCSESSAISTERCAPGTSNHELVRPDDVDPAVFAELPADIQQELSESWRAKTQQKNDNSRTKISKKTESLSPPKKKQKCRQYKDTKTKSILNYFSK